MLCSCLAFHVKHRGVGYPPFYRKAVTFVPYCFKPRPFLQHAYKHAQPHVNQLFSSKQKKL